jgi:methanogenic corrinoid protein MtbC1
MLFFNAFGNNDMKGISSDKAHKEFLRLLLSGNRAACSAYAHDYYRQHNSIQDLYENLLKKALYEVGRLWEFNKISVAAEHLASAIVEAILNEFYPEIVSREKGDKTVILTCIEQEMHQIGIKMVGDVFEKQGWNTYFLGANTPTKELIDYTKLIQPHLLGVSLSLYFHLPALEAMLQSIRREFSVMTVLVGGQAFRHGGREFLERYEQVFYKPDLNSVESFIENFEQYG